MKFTPISNLGEFKLIKKITANFSKNHESTKSGIGDDSAVLSLSSGQDYLISTDMLIEGVHFDLTYCPMKHVGYKSIVASVSDICAMNGIAQQVLVSLAIPNKYSVELITDLYDGIRLACKNYNLDLVGGDTTANHNNLVISVTILGSAVTEKTTYRSGAEENDLLVVSGNLGAAYLGLQILEREKSIFEKNKKAQPVLENYSYILERQLKPEARQDVIEMLKKLKIQPTSMIDISDGLSSECEHIAKRSSVGLKIFENKIPVAGPTILAAEELGVNPTTCALHGGEDYELLFTAPLSQHKKLLQAPDLSVIGHVTKNNNKVELISESGEVLDLKKEGWNSFIKQRRT